MIWTVTGERYGEREPGEAVLGLAVDAHAAAQLSHLKFDCCELAYSVLGRLLDPGLGDAVVAGVRVRAFSGQRL